MISYVIRRTTTFDVWKKLVVISQSLFGINGSIVAISLPYCCSRWRLWETIGATALPSPQQQLRNEERATKIDRQRTAGSKSVAEELEIASADSKKCSLVGRDHLVSIRDIWVFVLSSVKLRRISFRKWPYKEKGPKGGSWLERGPDEGSFVNSIAGLEWVERAYLRHAISIPICAKPIQFIIMSY